MNIVHRDIKLANILMSDSSAQARATIADFGSAAKLTSANDTLVWRIGTEGYTAPEMIDGKPYSFGVDVWGLGCLMYTILVSTNPFWRKELSSKVYKMKVCHEPLKLDSKLAT